MASPAIIWRNPNVVRQRRIWNRANRGATRSLYVVARSSATQSEWEGMPNLEMIEGGSARSAHNVSADKVNNRGAHSRL
jgi:hypothetical protein